MNSEAWHHQAVDYAEAAFRAEKAGDPGAAQRLFTQALTCEILAAQAWAAREDAEPTRTILYAGAAALAYKAQDYDQAAALLRQGRQGVAGHAVTEAFYADLAATIAQAVKEKAARGEAEWAGNQEWNITNGKELGNRQAKENEAGRRT